MKFDEVAWQLTGIPYTEPFKGKVLYDLVIKHRPKKILELGFAHGVSTCYLAAAAEEIGDCSISTVDLDISVAWQPSIEKTLNKVGLEKYVSVHRETSSYTWFLHREIEQQTRDNICTTKYDLIFIDGCKDWTNDGCAFFLCDKILNNNGMILFDDYDWTYNMHFKNIQTEKPQGFVFKDMSPEEFELPQIKCVFDLLVKQHHNYTDFEIIDGQLALARKKYGSENSKVIKFSSRYSLKYLLLSFCRKLIDKYIL